MKMEHLLILAMGLDSVVLLYNWDLAYGNMRCGFNSYKKLNECHETMCISENIHRSSEGHICA